MLRTFILMFLPLLVKFMQTICLNEEEPAWYISLCLFIVFALAVVGLWLLLRINKKRLHEEGFKEQFGTLYGNMRSTYWVIVLLARRLIHAVIIGLLLSPY